MTLHLDNSDYITLQRALELAAGYANNDVDEATIHALSTRLRHAQRHVPDADVARQAVVATITAVKDAARREQLTPAALDRIASELTGTETNLSPA
jgi:hypothetical protein